MKFIIIKLIHAYQFIISPFLHPSCRYEPTCSQYMIDAIQKKGILWGICLVYGVYCGVIPLGVPDMTR